MSIEQEPAVMNSLNLGVANKTGDNPYMAMSQKVTSEELVKAANGDTADITELQDHVNKLDTKVSAVEGKVEEIKTTTANKVDWSEYPSELGRKAIVLANHDSLTGTTTSGEGANLLMLSKWDVTDLGSIKVHTNLNTKDVVTINDRDVVVTDNNISTVVTPGNNIEITVGEASNHKTITVNSTALSEETADQKYLNKTESENFATKESLSNLETEVNNKVDSTYVDQKIADLVGGAPETLDTLKELSDALAEGNDAVVALTQQIGAVDTKVDAITLDSLGGAKREHTHTLADITDYQEPDLSDVVKYKEFEYNEPNRKTIQLDNYDSISGLTTGGVGANLVMLSKWDVADFGSTQVHMNLNTLDHVSINDDKLIATTDQIPDVSNFVTSDGLNSAVATKADLEHNHTLSQITDYVAPDLSGFATKTEVDEKVKSVTVDSIGAANAEHTHTLAEITDYQEPDLTPYATKVELSGKADTTALDSKLDKVEAASTYATKAEVSGLATKEELAQKADVSSLDSKLDKAEADNFATHDDLTTGLSNKLDTKTAESTYAKKTEIVDTVYWGRYPSEPTRKAIILANHDSITGTTTTDDGANLLMLSKWDVCDVGSTKIHMNLNTSQAVTVNDEALVLTDKNLGTSVIAGDNITITPTEVDVPDSETKLNTLVVGVTPNTFVETTEFDKTKQDIDNLKQEDISQDGVNISILNRLAALESQVDSLKKTNISVVDNISEGVSQPDQDLVISSQEPVVKTTTVVGKSVDFKNLNVDSSNMKITAEDGDVILNNINTTGELKKSTANTVFAINTNDYVRITQGDINQKSYNCIEIGLNNTEPKNIIIDGIDFNSDLSNNAILVFAHADNAVLTISNCHVKKCSNFLRLSNRTNHKLTVNIVNCQIDAWDTNPKWAGFLCLQDYTSANNEAALEAKLFASDKITINLTNVTGPNGKITTPEDMGLAFGSQNPEKQLGYVIYGPELITLPYTGNESMYPTFTFK